MIICLQISQTKRNIQYIPNMHALFNIHCGDLIPQSHHKLQDQKRE
jgi:hypothetical protein